MSKSLEKLALGQLQECLNHIVLVYGWHVIDYSILKAGDGGIESVEE